MIIVGNKIYLRPFEVEDAKCLQDLLKDFNGIKSYIGNPLPSNIENIKEWINKMYPHGDRKSIYFAIIEKETDNFCGYCIARDINYISRNAVVGTILLDISRGKGFFRDANYTFYDFLFGQINLHKLYSIILVSNIIAIEAHKKIGFEIEGHIKEHVFQDGVYKDIFFVSLYKNKFYEYYNSYQ